MTPDELQIFEAAKLVNAEQIRTLLLTPENPAYWLSACIPASDVDTADPVYTAIRQSIEGFFTYPGTVEDIEGLFQYVCRVYDDGYEEGYDAGKEEGYEA